LAVSWEPTTGVPLTVGGVVLVGGMPATCCGVMWEVFEAVPLALVAVTVTDIHQLSWAEVS
jgi:hypothetical protein